MAAAQRALADLQPLPDLRDHRGPGRDRPHSHADRHPPRTPAHGARLLGHAAARGPAHGPQTRPAPANQRLSLRADLRRRHRAGSAARGRRGSEARPHGLHHDQLLPPEDGACALCGRPLAAPGQEYAGNRRTGNQRTDLPHRHGDQLCAEPIRSGPRRHTLQPPRSRNGLGRDTLRGRGAGTQRNLCARDRGSDAQRSQGPAVGIGTQRRKDRFRQGHQPAQPKRCARLSTTTRRGTPPASGRESRPATDPRRSEIGENSPGRRTTGHRGADSIARAKLEYAEPTAAEPVVETPAAGKQNQSDPDSFFD